MGGYELAEEVFNNIGKSKDHKISIDDTIRVISFWGFNEESDINRGSSIGFVCYCARQRVKEIFEQALVYNDYSQFDEFQQKVNELKGEKDEK